LLSGGRGELQSACVAEPVQAAAGRSTALSSTYARNRSRDASLHAGHVT
jgi:hypothetical protein